FLSEDPIGLAGGMNPYAFGANDPVNLRDPDGRCPHCPAFVFGGAVVGAGSYLIGVALGRRQFSFGWLAASTVIGAGVGLMTAIVPTAGFTTAEATIVQVFHVAPWALTGETTIAALVGTSPAAPSEPTRGTRRGGSGGGGSPGRGPGSWPTASGGSRVSRIVGGRGGGCQYTLRITYYSDGSVEYDYNDDCGNSYNIRVGAMY
ncbi:MAG: RHS repeat-associated core domain-containing protein, partial [Gammaproteobacteria bacterium]